MKSTRPHPYPLIEFILDMSVVAFVFCSVLTWIIVGNTFFRDYTRCPDSTKGTLFGCAKVVDGVIVYVDAVDPRADEDRIIDQAEDVRIRFYGFSALGVGVVWVCVRRWVFTRVPETMNLSL